MNYKGWRDRWLKKPYSTAFIIALILIVIASIVFICYQKINRQFCEERLRSLEAVSSKISQNAYTRFDMQWKNLERTVRVLQSRNLQNEKELINELATLENAFGFDEKSGMLFLFDESGYYYGTEGKIGLWGDQKILQTKQNYLLAVTNLPKEEDHLDDFIVFFHRFAEPAQMGGITVTHVALAREMTIFDGDIEIGDYSDSDSSFIIRKNGTRIYHQSENDIFVNVYNILKAFENCKFEHGVTIEELKGKLLQGKSGTAHFIYDGTDYAMAYQPLNIDDWYAVYIMSMNSMSENTEAFILQTVILIGLAGAVLLTLFLALFGVNNYLWRIQQKETNRQLSEAVEEAKRASSAKSDFLSRMSHDIRTPLNGIVGMTEIAQRNINNTEKVKNCLAKITTSSDHLMTLINDVLDMSRIESGKTEIVSEPFNLQHTLEECFDIIDSRLYQREITFVCDFEKITHKRVVGDEIHLKQILINILGNAVKFTHNGGNITFCAVESKIEGVTNLYKEVTNLYQFEIADNGIGMSEEFLENLFDPFAQEVNGPRTNYQGTGLGMAIVKELVELMNGTIEVESYLNNGSRFVVSLPLVEDVAQQTDETEKEETVRQKSCIKKILLADDNALNREIGECILEDEGIELVTAEDGKQAVDVFALSQPYEFDAILMDVMMPVMDGLEATRAIRAMERADAKTIPIIALTANAYIEDEEKSKAAGMNAHLTKPIESFKVIKVLNELKNT